MKNNVLVIVATHGNEQFSIPVVKKLAQEFTFDWMIANPRAKRQNIRFIEKDLNRVGPGNWQSEYYEERRAVQVIRRAQKYDAIIDIHGTDADTGVFALVTNPDWKNIELAKSFDVANIVLWPNYTNRGPLTQFIENSIEIECGNKNSPETAQELERILRCYFQGIQPEVSQEFFMVTGSFTKAIKNTMREFTRYTYKNNSFYPLLINRYEGKTCYMMQKLNVTL